MRTYGARGTIPKSHLITAGSKTRYQSVRGQFRPRIERRRDTATVFNALVRNARRLPKELYRTLTWGRGKEMAAHRRFTLATHIQVYFCDPHHPWQRGSNANTTSMILQYLPKGTNMNSLA